MKREELAEAESGPSGRTILGLDADQRQEQRRIALIEAGLDQFAQHGYVGSSVESICQAAGVSTKSFYRLFDNREALYLALQQHFVDRVLRVLATALEESDREAEIETSNKMLDIFIGTYFDDVRWGIVIHGCSRALTPEVERRRLAHRMQSAKFLQSIWSKFGVPGDNTQVAFAVVGGIHDLFALALIEEDPTLPEVREDMAKWTKRYYWAARRGLTYQPA